MKYNGRRYLESIMFITKVYFAKHTNSTTIYQDIWNRNYEQK